jgi:hypothetical protein
VAFLVFMALKVKPKTLAEFSKPFDHIRAKKVIKILFFLSGLWCGLRVSVQGVKSLGGHFACLCRGFEFYEVKKKLLLFFKKKMEILLHFQ